MENFKVIEIDEDVIGYKKDLIAYLRSQLVNVAADKTIDNYILNYITEIIMRLEEDKNLTDTMLIRVFEHPMGGFSYKECEVVDVED